MNLEFKPRRSAYSPFDVSHASALVELRDRAEGGIEVVRVKDGNPKDNIGSRKVAFSVIPMTVLWELGNALSEGAYKYRRHNYRVAGVRASVYFDACVARHLAPWWEGEDIDPDSGESHITKAIASLTVLRDSMIKGNWVDDRPPKSDQALLLAANERAAALADKYQETAKPPHTELGIYD
jgi:hypothetical protein